MHTLFIQFSSSPFRFSWLCETVFVTSFKRIMDNIFESWALQTSCKIFSCLLDRDDFNFSTSF
ncbi:unnamed protein product [Schistosoma mattheei]|uniref:Uncharacterized protein n=1 Tax=Schistosoma mattheei TaxID=31246 RepID=A0A3P7XM41_9TREM|nr:unnamed protein product [Schistosoma mattheei]